MINITLKHKIWRGRELYHVKGYPLLGYIGFGVIDRGTNVLQVRPTTLCPLNCIFCSVDAGPMSRNRWAEFIVDQESIVETVKLFIPVKGGGIEALIDTIGDAFTYPYLEELVYKLKNLVGIRSIAAETHGALLSRERIDKLEKAGLDRINLSIDTLDPDKARILQGVKWYDVRRVIRLAEYIVKNTSIDLHVTPVWIPGVNDEDIVEVVKWAYRIGAGKKWPPVTVQKYNAHKYGRKVPGVKPLSWREFWRKIRELERKTGLRLTWSMEEWGMEKRPRITCPYRVRSKVFVKTLSRGVFRGEYIGLELENKWLITIPHKSLSLGENFLVEITHVKDCLPIGKIVGKA